MEDSGGKSHPAEMTLSRSRQGAVRGMVLGSGNPHSLCHTQDSLGSLHKSCHSSRTFSLIYKTKERTLIFIMNLLLTRYIYSFLLFNSPHNELDHWYLHITYEAQRG